jgi:predicted dehydrogenase
MSTKSVRIGIIGTGFITDGSHMPAFRSLPGVEIVAIAGHDPERTSKFAKKWGIKEIYSGVQAIEKLSASKTVDVVDIAIPNDLHLRAIEAAAENGKAVICEKPLGRNGKEAKRALRAVQKNDVIHCYAEDEVFAPQIVRSKEIVDSGAIGKVTWVRTREAHSGPHMKWFYEPARSGGGTIVDMGCHSIETGRYFLGKRNPLSVSAWTATLYHKTTAEDNSLVLIKYDGGALSQAENSWTARGGVDGRFEVYGTEGSIFIDTTRETGIRAFTTGASGKTGYIVEKADAEVGWMYPAWGEYITGGFLDEMKHFVECIRKGELPRENFQDGVLVNELMDDAYRSAKESRWITVSAPKIA